METQSLSLGEYQSRLEAIIRDYGYSFTLSTDALTQRAVENGNSRPRRVNSGYASRDKYDGISGQTNHNDRTVTVRDDLSPLDIARTTTHELAHIVLGHGPELANDRGFIQLAWLGSGVITSVVEAEAESCANAVLDQFGFADTIWSESYIDGWMSQVPDSVVSQGIMDGIVKIATHGAYRIVQLINTSAN